MRLLILSIILVLCKDSWAIMSYIPTTKLLKEKGYQLQLSGDHFMTSKRLDANGNRTALQSGEKFSRTQAEFGGFYGATDQLQFGIGARYRQHSSIFLDPNTNQNSNASSSGIQSTFFSAMYGFKPVDKLQYTIEGLFRFIPYSNDDFNAATDSRKKLVMGDEGNEYSLGLGVTYSSLGNNYLTFRGGYRKPGSEISSETYLQLEGALAWRLIALVAGVDSVISLKNDPYKNSPQNKPSFNTGISNLYNGTNREWVTPYAGVNVTLGDLWRVELRGSQVVAGKSTDMGTGFGIQLVRRYDRGNDKFVDSKFKAYDIECNVTKVSPKKEFVVIDKGLAQEIQKGTKIDFFEFDYVGGNVLIAKGIVIQVKADTAIVKITQRFNPKKEIKEGLIGRARVKE